MASTQQRHPWRATLRSALAFAVGLASVWGIVVEAAGLDPSWQWVSVSLVVATAVSRVMQTAAVLQLLERFAPWLLPEPPSSVESDGVQLLRSRD